MNKLKSLFAVSAVAISGIALGSTAGAVVVNDGDVANLQITDETLSVVADPGAGSLSLTSSDSFFLISATTNPTAAANGATAGVSLSQTFVNNSTSNVLVSAFIELPSIGMDGEFLTASVTSPLNNIVFTPTNVLQPFLVDVGASVTLNWGATTVNQSVEFIAGLGVSEVPVPAGILLMGTALAGLGVMRRRKNKVA